MQIANSVISIDVLKHLHREHYGAAALVAFRRVEPKFPSALLNNFGADVPAHVVMLSFLVFSQPSRFKNFFNTTIWPTSLSL